MSVLETLIMSDVNLKSLNGLLADLLARRADAARLRRRSRYTQTRARVCQVNPALAPIPNQ